MSISPKRRRALFILAGALLACGCQRPAGERIVIGSPALLFDRGYSAFDATQFGRSPWPATLGGVESIEQQTTVEVYRDFYGNATNERNTPQRRVYGTRAVTRTR